MSDEFWGFSHKDIDCLAALTNTVILDLSKVSERELSAIWSSTTSRHGIASRHDIIHATLRMKYGCTCGACICGILSPRMRFAILRAAEFCHEQLVWDLDNTDISGPGWVHDNDHYLRFLSGLVRQNLAANESSRRGFANMFDYVASCLREERLPTKENVLELYRNRSSEWPPVTKHYLERGGTVAAVASMVFQGAMAWDEWAGDGLHRMVFGEQIDELPPCRNDHEFGFVSGMCGYNLCPDDLLFASTLESLFGM
ncbi:uncharacterized protein DNG_09016 [Cephalotrichum gorgonifer]|uniref:Uncharacterized protein n=1 Tax=Cephalotrichum gorgonifer TaxID=2041049 RepID=A0AAE8N7J7_9PEZI|nr:uncharacterized protein DNG_09016 [Cephalotrichum gorgonifer]